MFIYYNTVERLKLNAPGVFGLFDKIGMTFPIEWQAEDRSREIKYSKFYSLPTTPPENRRSSISTSRSSMSINPNNYRTNTPFSPSSSTPIQNMISESNSGNISTLYDQPLSLPNSLEQIPSTNERQKKSKGLSFFKSRSQSINSAPIPYMLESDDNFRKLVLATPGLPHSLRRRLWFFASGGFKLSLQFSDAWAHACHAATFSETETNIQLTEGEFDAFLGGRIDTLTFLPPAVQLQISTFLHVFAHAQCGTVEFSPMISTAASLLLLYLEPSLAYLCLTAMVNRSKIDNGFYFLLSRPALLAESSVFRLLCEKLVKNVVRHADSIGINLEAIHLVCGPMFFFPFIPLQSALTLFDCFIVEGRKFILQFSLALLQSEERNLLQTMDVDSFVEVIVNALERLADVNVLKSFILKNVERIDIGKWRRIISLEQSYMDPKNKKMISFEIRDDDPALASFEQRIEAENISYEEEETNNTNDDDEGDIDINLNLFGNGQKSDKSTINDIVNNNNNNNMNTCGSYNNNSKAKTPNFDDFEKSPTAPSFDKETDSLLSSSDVQGFRQLKAKKPANIRTSASSQIRYAPSSLDTIKYNLISSNDELDAAQRMMAPTIKQSLPKIHGGRLLDVHLFYQIRSRLPPVYHRFSCQLIFAKSLNGGSLENLISATNLSYTPSSSSSLSILSSNSSIMFSSSSLKNNIFSENNDNDSSENVNNYQCSLPHILMIQTSSGKKFGALLSDPLLCYSENTYYGRQMTFVFDANSPQIFQRSPCPNNMFIMSSPDSLCIGGAEPAIRLSGDLAAVESYACDTFGSPSLISGNSVAASDGVIEVEVYRLRNNAKKAPAGKMYAAKMV